MTDTLSSDTLKNLVWFLIGLAILGTILALVLYFMGAGPVEQVALHPPANPAY